MKLQTKLRLAETYNQPDTTIVIASFPGRKNRSIKEIDAVASYTDHFTRSFKSELKRHSKRLVVIAQITDQEEWYEEGNMLVARVWKKDSPFTFFQILRALLFFSKARAILVQFEFHQFGGKLMTLLFPVFLAALRGLRKHVTVVLHQVVTDITALSGHVNIKGRTIRSKIFNFSLRGLYRLVGILANTIVVHNAVLAQRLQRLTGKDAVVIPHGLGAISKRAGRKEARKLLGYTKKDFVVMYFGFLTWYKGADWLVKQFGKHKNKRGKLLLAGGTSPNVADAPHYQRFIRAISRRIARCTNIQHTGFVEDKDLSRYFAAADVVVLPYRTLMSSSGPLAMALAFQKPVLISRALLPYAEDEDFTRSLQIAKLTTDSISFSLRGNDFWNKVAAVKNHPRPYRSFSTRLRQSRVWEVVSERFHEILALAHVAPAGKSAIIQGELTASYARI